VIRHLSALEDSDLTGDEELMEEIRKAGDVAAEGAPQLLDLLAVATELGRVYDHRTVEDIREQLVTHFQSRGLLFAN